MNFVRAIDWSAPDTQLAQGYKGQILYHGESCVIVVVQVSPGADSPEHHIHRHADQIYYVVDGEITIDLDGDVRTASKGTAVFIPAGLAHHGWNAGRESVIQIEIIAPGPCPDLEIIAPGYTPIAPNSEPATSSIHDDLRPPFVAERKDGPSCDWADMAMHWLVNRDGGARHASLYVATVPPGGGSGPALQTHQFDRFYFVLDGRLTVEVGLERYVVPAQNLVVVPAGVPHRQWNEGPGDERHCVILAPEPAVPHSAAAPWDVEVTLAPA